MAISSTIYLMIDEGLFRPIEAEFIRDMVYRILPSPDYDPEGEKWEFPPGTIVRCVYMELLKYDKLRHKTYGEKELVAYEKLSAF